MARWIWATCWWGMVVGCGTSSDYTAEELLVQNAIAGEEETVQKEGMNLQEAPPLPMMRECDAEGSFLALLNEADVDGSGALEPKEQQSVQGQKPPPFPPHVWHLLHYVYDADRSADLSESERAELLADFTERCDALHAKLLAEFDVDGSGDLSDEELVAVKEAMDDRRPPPPPRCGPPPQDGGDTGAPPQPPQEGSAGPQGTGGSFGPPPGGAPPDGCERPAIDDVPPPLLTYDVDGDGALSEEEFTTMRDAVRVRLRAGEPPVPHPDQP